MTISAIRKERRRFLLDLKPLARLVDTKIEALERELVRLLARKRDVPENDDLVRLRDLNENISVGAAAVKAYLRRGFKN